MDLNPVPVTYPINFREVTYALSEALDLVGIDDVYHGKRVAYMAAECAKMAGYSAEKVDDLIYLGMLHDCGVSNTDTHVHLVEELDWAHSQDHAKRGYHLLDKVSVFQKYAEPVFYHHTYWNKLELLDIGEEVKRHANLIFLVDRVDAMRAQVPSSEAGAEEFVRNTIAENSGTMFSPALVELFLKTSRKQSFWYYLESFALEDYFQEWLKSGTVENISFSTLKEIALMFADIVDAKSPFTHEHSLGVATLAVFLAEQLGLDQSRREKIELAALLHDLGKLKIEDSILDKQGPLDDNERIIINRHGFVSGLILRKIHGFWEIAKLASTHHETLDGEGYPFRMSKEQLSIEERIITVADIFQALVQDRPYRKSLGAETALSIIESQQHEGKLDGEIVSLLHANLDAAYQCARSACPS